MVAVAETIHSCASQPQARLLVQTRRRTTGRGTSGPKVVASGRSLVVTRATPTLRRTRHGV